MWEAVGLPVLRSSFCLLGCSGEPDLVFALLEKGHHEGLLGTWPMATQEAGQSWIHTLSFKSQRTSPDNAASRSNKGAPSCDKPGTPSRGTSRGGGGRGDWSAQLPSEALGGGLQVSPSLEASFVSSTKEGGKQSFRWSALKMTVQRNSYDPQILWDTFWTQISKRNAMPTGFVCH